MTALLADPVSEVVAAAERLLERRTGAPVTLVDPVDLGGSGRTVVLRVRCAANPFSLPRTLVIKQVRELSEVAHARSVAGYPGGTAGDGTFEGDLLGRGGAAGGEVAETAFLREAVSYQFATALATDSRPGPSLIAYDLSARLLILTDLGDADPLARLLVRQDEAAVTNSLMALAQSLGRMHAATVGREEDFAALLRRSGVAHLGNAVSGQVATTIPKLPGMLDRDLGAAPASEVIEMAQRATALFDGGRHRAFSPSDLCPDNIIVNDEGVRFLDYEWGGFRDATLDLAYALISFPGCLCSFELSTQRSLAMVEAWRAEVVGMWPHLADDRTLYARLLEAQLVWVWLSTYWFLPEDHARIAAVREHQLSAPRSKALTARWRALGEFAEHAQVAVVADHARDVADRLADVWT
ncbi:kinase [Rhodococcus sp. NPDC058505]|uniref:phosphotransferase family protein n=1 Tax=unclassified Rhodococcus (in: high G+C Gram-positive bacteria) TaxID=192944 RepID=UPI0036641CF3